MGIMTAHHHRHHLLLRTTIVARLVILPAAVDSLVVEDSPVAAPAEAGNSPLIKLEIIAQNRAIFSIFDIIKR